MTCREIVEFLMHYLEGQLDPVQRAVFEEHLGACGECVAFLHNYKETARIGPCLCGQPEAPVPEDLIQAILAAQAAVPKPPDPC